MCSDLMTSPVPVLRECLWAKRAAVGLIFGVTLTMPDAVVLVRGHVRADGAEIHLPVSHRPSTPEVGVDRVHHL